MSVKVMGAVWDLKIESDEKLVLLAYADHADHDGFSIFPAVSTVAKKTGYSERSVQRITHRLEGLGLLIADGKGSHGTNKWRIPIYGGAILSPRTDGTGDRIEVGGDKNDTSGVTNTTPGGDTAMSPEPSLTIIKPSIKENEFKKTFDAGAYQVFGNNFVIWRELQNYLINAKYQIDNDNCLIVSGIGLPAAMLQDRYSAAFSNALAGIYNHEIKVVFEE